MRRKWEHIIANNTDSTFTQWHTIVFENNLDKANYLNKTFPHLSLVKIVSGVMYIDDTKKNDIVKVQLIGNKVKASMPGEEYVLFALLHPEFQV